MKKIFFLKLKLLFIPCQSNKYRPQVLNSKFLFYYGIFLLLLKIAIIPFFSYLPKTAFFADLTKANLIEFTNKTRKYFDLPFLKENSVLNQAAYLKVKDMIEKDYFSHFSPEGITPWYWLKISGYDYKLAGENLAIGFLESEQVHLAWMNSSSHRQNILNPNYQEIGIAVLKGDFQGRETTMVVQFFGTKKIPEVPKKTFIKNIKEDVVMPKEPPIIEKEIEQPKELEEIAPIQEFKEKKPISLSKDFIKTPNFILFKFMTSNYYELIQKIIYGSLILIIFSLLITVLYDIFIYRKFEIQYKDVIGKTIGFSVLWFVLLFLDKIIMINLINPQEFMIY